MRRVVGMSLVAILAAVVAAGCSATGSGAGPQSTGSPASSSPSVASARTYKLPKKMCSAADLTPIADLYPNSDTPLVDTPGDCSVGRSSAAKASVSVGINGQLFPDSSTADQFLTAARGVMAGATTIPGVGSDAWYAVTGDTVTLWAVDGNLLLQVTVAASQVADMPQRCGRIASGTFARLAAA